MELLAAVRNVFASAPLVHAAHAEVGTAVLRCACRTAEPLGWVSDESRIPVSSDASRDRTALAIDAGSTHSESWNELGEYPKPPEACLINFYGPTAKMGLHQDRDEADFDAPVISISLGDSCLFRVGGLKRSGPTRAFRLSSGDALVLGGASRLAFHGVDRIYPGTSRLLPEGGRINLTLRRVTRSAPDSSSFHPHRGSVCSAIPPSALSALLVSPP